MNAIDVQSLTKNIAVGFLGRNRTLIRDVSFDVPQGGLVGFVGPNGAGKSTTIKHLIGVAKPTSGSVAVFGAAPTSARARRRIGYLPERPNLPPELSPRELMQMHAVLADVARPASRIDALLKLVELDAHADARVGKFSKGMQQRCTLALVLLADADLLILDEPMSGLDPLGRELVRRIMRDENARGKTILFSTHALADVEAMCSHVVVMNQGRVVDRQLVHTGMGRARGVRVTALAPTLGEAAEVADLGVVARIGRVVTVDVLLPADAPAASTDARVGLAVAQTLVGRGFAVESVEVLRASLEEHILTTLKQQPAKEGT